MSLEAAAALQQSEQLSSMRLGYSRPGSLFLVYGLLVQRERGLVQIIRVKAASREHPFNTRCGGNLWIKMAA
jgi:hypothetical protein